jgi:hypothetical protein
MNETEKQNYIRLQTIKLQKLADIVSAANELIYSNSTNIRSVSDYNNKDHGIGSDDTYLFRAVDEYKELLVHFGELK